MLKWISDLHFYEDVGRSMNSLDYVDFITERWNCTVDNSDIIIVCGDIGAHTPKTLDAYAKLKGTKYLILGNHEEDPDWLREIMKSGIFSEVLPCIGTSSVYVSHKPVLLTERINDQRVHIHGHHHDYNSTKMRNEYRLYITDTNRYNCSADLNGNKPCTLRELELNKARLIESKYFI